MPRHKFSNHVHSLKRIELAVEDKHDALVDERAILALAKQHGGQSLVTQTFGVGDVQALFSALSGMGCDVHWGSFLVATLWRPPLAFPDRVRRRTSAGLTMLRMCSLMAKLITGGERERCLHVSAHYSVFLGKFFHSIL